MSSNLATVLNAKSIADRLRDELHGASLISIPQHPSCKVTVLTPVFAEDPRRLLGQLESLAQQNLGPQQLEVIYVVNNRPDDDTEAWWENYELNQLILSLPVFRNRPGLPRAPYADRFRRIRERLAVYAIDNSSPGLWVEDSNVGRGRQRGLLESALRTAALDRNSIILHTDADCRYEDPTFMSQLFKLFQDPTVLAMAGTYTLELEPDDPEAFGMAELLERYVMYRRYCRLFENIRQGFIKFEGQKMLGRCIAHRAFEGIEVGGIDPISLGEDVAFGEKLRAYAAEHGQQVVNGRPLGLGPVTAMRVSDRTPNTIQLAQVSAGDMYVEDAFDPGRQVILDQAYLDRLVAAVQAMPDGESLIRHLFVSSPLAHVRIRRV